MSNQKLIFEYPLAFLFLAFFSSCSIVEKNSGRVFMYNESAGVSSLDPAFARNQANMWPVHQIFNTLVEYDDSLHLKPSLAKSWTFSSDKLEIKFILRNDVYFHDDPSFKNGKGRKLLAKDVVFSLNRLLEKSLASPGAWIFSNKLNTSNPFTAPADSVFCIRLLKPDITVLSSLSMPYCSIVPEESVKYYGKDFRSHPVGTGPFQLVNWDESEAIILHRNPHYFEKDAGGNSLPYLEGIKISFLGSKTSEFLAFQQQQLDFINDPDASMKDELISKTGHLKGVWKDKFNMITGPYLNTEYLGFIVNEDISSSVSQQLNIRKAINYAIDKKKMIFYLRNSIGIPAESGFAPIGLPSFDSNAVKGYHFCIDSAVALLKSCGFDASHPMPPITLLTVPNYASLGTFIANELKAIGIELKVEIVQKALLMEQMSKGEAPFFRGSWIADFPEALNFFSVFYSKNPAPPNYTRFSNASFDLLFENAVAEYDEEKRFELYHQMENIIITEAPVVPLWYDRIWQLHQRNIKGMKTSPLNMLELRRVIKE